MFLLTSTKPSRKYNHHALLPISSDQGLLLKFLILNHTYKKKII